MNHYIWVEKYRPTKLEDFLTTDDVRATLQSFVDKQTIPHLLFVGHPGIGKTTIAKVLTSLIDCDVLCINASDDNNIETVRTTIRDYVSSAGFAPLKIAILDEFDGFTRQGQEALRNLMEEFSEGTRFILTANYIDRVIDPIISRSQQIALPAPSRQAVAKYVVNILKAEDIKFNIEDVKTLILRYYPDLRKLINACQLLSPTGTLNVGAQTAPLHTDTGAKIVEALSASGVTMEEKFISIRTLIANTAKISSYDAFYRLLFDRVTDYASDIAVPMCIIEINEGQFKDHFVVDKEINFMSTIVNILKQIT